ncbi:MULTISPECIES: thiolase family protein [Sphingomonadaceae]|jgi:acetyl-CoA acetyltransferase|nr:MULTISPECIES: thiolase family protein [unclassified Sphingorhabdus]ASK87134.1 acetyl-CoA acetyltransferase [Sphingorhabdus sp. SMR4y]VWX62206.1 Acetyl-CoA acetyltransferase [Sphingorhabdus sp. 109]|tara:strand:- start:4940 stop:6190 length:1251 start_codon:yes stop_codon:yes gene_type:complete
MEKAYIVGVGMTKFGRHPDQSIRQLLDTAISTALGDAGGHKSDVEAVYHSSSTQGFLQGQTFIPGQVALGQIGLSGIPVFNIENACASSSSSFHLAVQGVGSGMHDIILAAGVEKMNVPDKKKMFAVFDGAWDVATVDENIERLVSLGKGMECPEGSESERPYSIFMKVYAAFGLNHMKRNGTTQRQIAAIAAKNHEHSVHNEYSQYRQAYSIEEVLAAPPITYPLTLPMCAPISDGAAAAVICNEEGLKKLGMDKSRAVEILASVSMSGNAERTADEPENHMARLAAQKAYQMAGRSPDDMDVAEVHDATAIGELMHAENLMLAPLGEAGPAAERGDFTVGGRIPINPSGGLESKGHPIGATGLGQLHELVTQLRGEAGKRQVENARHAIHENSGGLVGIEEGAAVINILGKVEA